MTTPASPRTPAAPAPTPGLRWGDYPERDGRVDPPPRGLVDALPFGALLGTVLAAPFALPFIAPLTAPFASAIALRRYRGPLAEAQAHALSYRALSAPDFAAAREDVRARLAAEGLAHAALAQALGYASEAARRALGLAAYECQLLAALVMLDNRLAEMATGEGKSLAAALTAGVGALAGMPVHVLTANDYLVARDARSFEPFYSALGLDVATVLAPDPPERRRSAYAQPVVYVTASQLAFDYLRDRLFHGTGQPALQRRVHALAAPDAERPLLRGLCMAVIDEADNILIDEAQTPLVLSRESTDPAQRAFLWQAYALSGRLDEGTHFERLGGEGRIVLTEPGRARVAALSAQLQPVWKNTLHREETIVAALTARHVFVRDRDYVLVTAEAPGEAQGKTELRIVDAVSGRIAEGRQWARGLHALVAIKEACRVEPELETLAQITYQRFFRRYHRCGGMSGSLREARGELSALYGLTLVTVPLRFPSRRIELPARCFVDDSARWPAVVERARALRTQRRPVLIGTGSVAESLALSRHFTQAGLRHAVLNAGDAAGESQIVALAGRAGAITLSTNMAGRGTDIDLDAQALVAGGLHVISCQHNASRRHDRQLAGRAARQGQAGSSETWTTLASPQFTLTAISRWSTRLCRGFVRDGEVRLPGRWLGALLRLTQRAQEAQLERRRRALFRRDADSERGLSFTALRE